jgi:serine/threonine-protein kinase
VVLYPGSRFRGENVAGRCLEEVTNRTLARARLYASAFAADPRLAGDPGTGQFRAACAAALVGCGRGTDAAGLGEEEKARWREQARQWLRKDLTAWEQLLSAASGRLRAAQTLTRWRGDPDLTGLRAPSELARLSAEERIDCVSLWAEFDDLLNRARGTELKP